MTNLNYMLTVNGTEYPISAPLDQNLLGAIRNQVGLTGTKEGCDDCECGACMVLLDGQPVNSCSYLAVQAQGRAITTVEGLGVSEETKMTSTAVSLHPLQQQLLDAGGVQCGFCTPGMLMSAAALLEQTPNPTLEEIRIGLSGNLCRCTGYAKIFEAVAADGPRMPDEA